MIVNVINRAGQLFGWATDSLGIRIETLTRTCVNHWTRSRQTTIKTSLLHDF